ncbi:hypothetical protein NHX12_031843 [Muraenolepis orangiensis]|uniref:Uncharacterized protein n=1 Tax=Muraenolepis orangiensis TaxID=630683 RepID=A0A9Q0E6C5_9TELE|nr:hypothetical protein NHX12_031843 [Muraenolepis orangiensis]
MECRYCQRQEERSRGEPVVAAVHPGSDEGWLPLSSQELSHHQAADDTLGRVQGWLEEGRRPAWPEVSAACLEVKVYHAQWANLELRDGVVHRRWQAHGRGTDLLQLLVPRLLRPRVLQLVHRAMGAGHFGNTKDPAPSTWAVLLVGVPAGSGTSCSLL